MKARIIAALGSLLAVIAFFSSAFVIDETEAAIITRFGEFQREIVSPGLYFKAPFVDSIQSMDRRIITSNTPPAEYLTLDKKRLVADPVTRWRITEPLVFYKTVRDESGARARIDDMVNSELRRKLASKPFDQIVGQERDTMMQEVATETRDKTREFGIEIIDVRIKRADLPKEVQESVFARMRAEREKVAKGYRSEGEEEALKIRADTDKAREILLAEGNKTAKESRGQGDATSTTIYAAAYSKDPEFYAFMRSLEAYERAMNDKSELILSTRAPLFKYLIQPGGKDPVRD